MCTHKWIRIFNYPLRICVKCGALKIGKHTVVISASGINMGSTTSSDITNLHNIGASGTPAGTVYATDLQGTVHYGDLYSTDTTCQVCNKKFKKGDTVVMKVTKVKKGEFASVPVHLKCLSI